MLMLHADGDAHAVEPVARDVAKTGTRVSQLRDAARVEMQLGSRAHIASLTYDRMPGSETTGSSRSASAEAARKC